MSRVTAWWEHFETFLAHVAGFIALIMAFTIAYDVIMRYLFASATLWSRSLNLVTLIFLVFLGGAWTALVEGHVRVDILFIRLPPRSHAIVDIIGTVIALGFITYLAIACVQMALQSLRLGLTSIQAMEWPLFPVHLVMVIGTCLLGLELISHLVKTIRSLRIVSTHAADTESLASGDEV